MNTDEIIDSLLAKVEQKTKEIKNLERPTWKTSCVFGYNQGPNKVQIQATKDLDVLVGIFAWCENQKVAWEVSCTLLDINRVCKVDGYSLDDWQADVKTRLDQIQIESKRKELKSYEDKLNELISPEKRREIELKKLAALLA